MNDRIENMVFTELYMEFMVLESGRNIHPAVLAEGWETSRPVSQSAGTFIPCS